MQKTKPGLSRRQAFLIHLAFSLVIFFILASILVFIWYPGPLFHLEGGWRGIRIVAFVDIILGPLLTLIIFKPGKPGLKLDMSVIISIQLVALIWGTWTVHQARPALVVFAIDSFYSIPLSALEDASMPQEQYKRFIKASPSWIYVEYPADPIKYADLLAKHIREKKPGYLHFDSYRPLSENQNKVLSKALPINAYTKNLPEKYQEIVNDYLATLDQPQTELAFFPLKTNKRVGLIIIEKESLGVVDYLAVPFDAGLGFMAEQAIDQSKQNEPVPPTD